MMIFLLQNHDDHPRTSPLVPQKHDDHDDKLCIAIIAGLVDHDYKHMYCRITVITRCSPACTAGTASLIEYCGSQTNTAVSGHCSRVTPWRGGVYPKPIMQSVIQSSSQFLPWGVGGRSYAYMYKQRQNLTKNRP